MALIAQKVSGNYAANFDLSEDYVSRSEVKMLGQLCQEEKWLKQTWPKRRAWPPDISQNEVVCQNVHVCIHASIFI